MTEDTCTCCRPVETDRADGERERERGAEPPAEPGSTASTDRWLGESAITEKPLPDDVRTAMERFFGDASIETLGDWIAELRRRTGGALEVDDLCHADGATDHWGELDGERYDFRCFYDAVALAELASESVDVHTVSPTGATIEARASGDGELTATPSTAVVSFGIATDTPRSTDGDLTLEDAYAAICPTVRAFSTRRAYEKWAERAPAATVGMPLSAATVVATHLVEQNAGRSD